MSVAGPAEAYDRHTGRYGPELSAAFVRFAGVKPGMRVLDVGSGPGALAATLAEVVGGDNVAAVDPSEDYAAACRVRVPGVVATCVWDFRGGMPLLDAYWAAAMTVDPIGARDAAGDLADPWCTPDGLRRLWIEAGVEQVESAELALREEFRVRLGAPDGPFRLVARAWAVRGRHG